MVQHRYDQLRRRQVYAGYNLGFMAVSEFSIIERYFTRQSLSRPDVALGIGDDCALLRVSGGETLAVTLDMLVAGVHFFAEADPEGIGHKALAVNLSDLAAMGARPAWATLALSLPDFDETWLERFCRGFFNLAERFGVQLVGGDTTRGPLTITIQAHGLVPEAQALRRDGARPGDIVFVTGSLGDAGLALAAAQGKTAAIAPAYRSYLQARLERPMPRIHEGITLRGLASAAIDISDGLAQDLGHIMARSQVGARLDVDRLPCSPVLTESLDQDAAVAMILGSGDDYELCFTVPAHQVEQVRVLTETWECGCTEIGVIEAGPGLRCLWSDGTPYRPERLGYDHFSAP